jgi:hypothetical protein
MPTPIPTATPTSGEALLIVEGDDPGAVMLAAAFRRHGWRVRLLDLRFQRPTLDGSDDPPVVLIDGTPVRPDLVINRSATSRLGLAPASALGRQVGTTWSARHLGAREEQALLLACLDLWERTSRLYNPVRTLDRRLLRVATEAELRNDGVPVIDGEPETNGREGTCWVVDGRVVASGTKTTKDGWAATAVSDTTAATVATTAKTTGLALGQVDLWQPRQGPTAVTDWRPIPWFRAFWEQTGSDVAALVVAALVHRAPAAPPGFLVADLEPNLLNVGKSARL